MNGIDLNGIDELCNALQELRERSLRYGAELRRTVKAPNVSAAEREYAIDDIIENVPTLWITLYGEEKGKQLWPGFVRLYYSKMSSGMEAEVIAALTDIIDLYDKQLRMMYKGKNGKDYVSSEEVKSANDFYIQQENPTIEHGRSR